jgi:hypothetical protein
MEYDFDGRHYSAIHPDGRAEFYSAGPMSWTEVEVFRGYPIFPDGKIDYQRPQYDKVLHFCSPRTEGLGGSKVPIRLTDGSEGYLRGAWCGWKPPGFMECAYRAEHVGIGGYCSEELFLKLLAFYQPHLGAAHVDLGYIKHMEPTLYPDCPPKAFPNAPKFYTDTPRTTRIGRYMRNRLLSLGVSPEDLPDPSTDYRSM